MLMNPASTFSFDEPHGFNFLSWSFLICLWVDACRKPIPWSGWKGCGKYILCMVIVLLLPVLLFRQFVIQANEISSDSMSPTLLGGVADAQGNVIGGDHIFVNKLAYNRSEPARGDVVLFRTTDGMGPLVKTGTVFVKRVVGLPGETISIDPPSVLVDGVVLDAPGIFYGMTQGTEGYEGYTLAHAIDGACLVSAHDSVSLADDEYLLLGDNSRKSLDGRYFGPVSRENILGKVIYIFAPADRKKWMP